MSSTIDLGQPVKRGSVELGPPEHDDERAARLRREDRKDLREHVLFFVSLASVLGVGSACAWVGLFSASTDAETRAFARTVLVGLFSGGISFLFSRALAKN